MKRWLWILVFLLSLIEIFSVRQRFLPHGPKAGHVLTGAIHVHSHFSDGGGSPEEIATAAKEAGLDFVVLTDHNDTRARSEGFEKNYNGLDLFVEMEASTPAGHAVTFFSHTNAKNLADPRVSDMSYEHIIGQPSVPGLFLASAHPSNIKNPWTRLDRLPEGMEIINFDSSWQRQLAESPLSFLVTVASFSMNNFLGALRFARFHEKDLMTWDAANSISPGHFGILGHDTHSKLKLNQDLVFRWPDYRSSFRLASNAVFLKESPPSDFEARKGQLYRSIRGGRIAVVFHLVHPFAGNEWSLVCGDHTFISGDMAPQSPDCHFLIVTPGGLATKLRLLQDGKPVWEKSSTEGIERVNLTGPGVYRLEVYAEIRSAFHLLLGHDVPYVFYNPIYVR